MDLVSIVVPVYNTSAYLGNCVESLIAIDSDKVQFEIILVNDGSTDGSGAMCDGYALRDSRIVVIHQENLGASAARNSGLDVATGSYFMFVDSDDFVAPAIIDYLYTLLMQHNADISMCNCIIVDASGNNEHKLERSVKGKISGEEAFSKVADGMFYSVACTLFRRSTWGDTRFPENMAVNEDAFVMSSVLLKASVIYLGSDACYYYRKHNSSSSSSFTHAKFKDAVGFQRAYLSLASKHYHGKQMHYYIDNYVYRLFTISLVCHLAKYTINAVELDHLVACAERVISRKGVKLGLRSTTAYCLLKLPLPLHHAALSVLALVAKLKERVKRLQA